MVGGSLGGGRSKKGEREVHVKGLRFVIVVVSGGPLGGAPEGAGGWREGRTAGRGGVVEGWEGWEGARGGPAGGLGGGLTRGSDGWSAGG